MIIRTPIIQVLGTYKVSVHDGAAFAGVEEGVYEAGPEPIACRKYNEKSRGIKNSGDKKYREESELPRNL